MSEPSLEMLLRALKLPAFAEHYPEVSRQAATEGLSFDAALRRLVELELDSRRQHKLQRLRRESQLPAEKTLAALDLDRFPLKVRRQLPALCEGGFLDRAENVLAFGLPGRGKTHLLCAIGHELVQRGRSVLFASTCKLVERLLGAKRALALEDELKGLDRFDAVILDDIGYVQQSREEMEVLFTFLAERYERRSVLITSNLVFSQWDRIFKDPMTTAAAIDRVVHHALILELTGQSKRADDARARDGKPPPPPSPAP
jgi:DNA replication protein DnaC